MRNRRAGRRRGDLMPVIVQFGGQTPLNLAAPLAAGGVPLLGADLEAIDQAEERTRFAALLDRLGIPQPEGGMAHQRRGGAHARRAHRLPGHRAAVVRHRRPGHRLLLLARRTSPGSSRRPRSSTRIGRCASTATSRASRSTSTPSRTARRAHPGPPRARRAGRRPHRRLGRHLPAADASSAGTRSSSWTRWSGASGRSVSRGLVNAQFIVREDGVYLIEVNPRASRTVPFLSKVTGVPMVELAVRIALGANLRELGWPGGLLAAAAVRGGQGARRSRPPSCAAWTRRSGRACSRPAR